MKTKNFRTIYDSLEYTWRKLAKSSSFNNKPNNSCTKSSLLRLLDTDSSQGNNSDVFIKTYADSSKMKRQQKYNDGKKQMKKKTTKVFKKNQKKTKEETGQVPFILNASSKSTQVCVISYN